VKRDSRTPKLSRADEEAISRAAELREARIAAEKRRAMRDARIAEQTVCSRPKGIRKTKLDTRCCRVQNSS
jgi:hypothetical protein